MRRGVDQRNDHEFKSAFGNELGKKELTWWNTPSTGLWMTTNWKKGSGGLNCCVKGLKQKT